MFVSCVEAFAWGSTEFYLFRSWDGGVQLIVKSISTEWMLVFMGVSSRFSDSIDRAA